MGLTTHHTGCVVNSIEETTNHYRSLFPNLSASEVFHISSQKVSVCFLNISQDDVHIELVQPHEENRALKKLIDKKSNFYHIGYLSDNYDNDIKSIEDNGGFLLSEFNSPAFNSKRCTFVMTRDQHLLEIIEK